jgi:hypothetical protein
MLKHRTRTAALAVAVSLAVILACAGIKKGDEVVVAAERVEGSAFYLTDAFVTLERKNPILEEKVPGIHAAAEKIRHTAPTAIRQLHALIDQYSAATPGTAKPDLTSALALVNSLISDVTTWLTRAAIHDPAAAEILKNPQAKVSLFVIPDWGSPGSALPLAAGFTVDFAALLALLRVIATSGSDLGADATVLSTLYNNLKTLWTKTERSTAEQRQILADAEEAAFNSGNWKPDEPAARKGRKDR